MIPATERYQATFVDDEPVPVVGWNDDGEALVCDRPTGKLVLARTLPRFRAVIRPEPTYQVIPGGGWLGEFEYGGKRSTVPVVAWLVAPDGFGRALFTDNKGVIQEWTGGDYPEPDPNIIRVWHPDMPSGESASN